MLLMIHITDHATGFFDASKYLNYGTKKKLVRRILILGTRSLSKTRLHFQRKKKNTRDNVKIL